MSSRLPLVRPTIIDRAIGYFAPVHGVARYRARAQMAIAGQWLGARTDRRETAGWVPYAGSADADNLHDLPILRTRTRDLQRRNPLALGAVNTAVTSIIGTGLSLRSRIDAKRLGLSDEEAREWQAQTECEFRSWAENPVACDAEATLDFYSQQALALRSALDSGDVFGLLPMVKRPGSLYETKVQLVEADRVCNRDNAPDTERIAGGIVTDQLGAPVAYHILRSHPGSLMLGASGRVWDEIAAFGAQSGRRNVVHLFEKRRPGQRRGMPFLAPVIEALHQLGEYSNAELRAAVVGALFTVFVKTPAGVGLGLDDTGVAPTQTPESGDNIKLGTGAIIDLAAGEEIEQANPMRPNQAFEPFVNATLGYIGAALEIPKEVLLKHFTSSYTAGRAAFLEAWRFFRGRRERVGGGFCQPVYEAWLEEAVARGRIAAPGFFDDPAIRMAYCGTEWIGDAPGQIDPGKEIDAAASRIEAGLSNHEIETMQLMGLPWQEVHAQLARELEERRSKKTITNPQQPGAPDPAPKDDETDDEDEET